MPVEVSALPQVSAVRAPPGAAVRRTRLRRHPRPVAAGPPSMTAGLPSVLRLGLWSRSRACVSAAAARIR